MVGFQKCGLYVSILNACSYRPAGLNAEPSGGPHSERRGTPRAGVSDKWQSREGSWVAVELSPRKHEPEAAFPMYCARIPVKSYCFYFSVPQLVFLSFTVIQVGV